MDETGGKTGMERYFHLKSHQLQSLLARETAGAVIWPVDARARISVVKEGLRPTRNLVDLEHARMHEAMLPPATDNPNAPSVQRSASLHWASSENLWLTGLLPQFQRFAMIRRRAWMSRCCLTMRKSGCCCIAWSMSGIAGNPCTCRSMRSSGIRCRWRASRLAASHRGCEAACWRI